MISPTAHSFPNETLWHYYCPFIYADYEKPLKNNRLTGKLDKEIDGKTAKDCKESEEEAMASQFDTRTDTVVLIFSTLAVLIAATLSMATISSNPDTARIDSPGRG